MLEFRDPAKEQLEEPVLEKETPMVSLIEIMDLPSKFRPYPEGTRIFYAPMTLEEVEVLNSGTINTARALKFLLAAIHCDTVKPEDLAYFDVVYIGVQRKLTALGDVRGSISKQCLVCGQITTHDLIYTELEFKTLDFNLPAKTTIRGQALEFGILSVKQLFELPDNDIIAVYAAMIKNKTYEEAYELLSNTTGKDVLKLQAISRALDYGIEPIKTPCTGTITYLEGDKEVKTKCNQMLVMEVTSPFDVVFPVYESSNYNELEIRFGDE
jgi:hypothetical protein